MALRRSAVIALLSCACLCVLLEPAPADDSFLSRKYSQEVLRKLEQEIFSKTTPLQPLDYLMIYVIELKLGISILNDTVSGIGRQYHDMWKKETESLDRVSGNPQCSCNDRDVDEVRDLRGKMDAIQGDVQRVLEQLKNVSTAAVTCEPSTTKPGQVTPSENRTEVRLPGPEKEESEVNDAIRKFKSSKWKKVKKSLSNVLAKTSPAFQQLQNVKAQDRTPLLTIIKEGYTRLLEELLDRGLPLDTWADESWRYDILSAAAINGKVAVVEQLLWHGASIDSINNHGVTPLMFAAYHNHLNVVKALVCHGADVNHRDKDGDTALDLARKRKQKDVVEYLSFISHWKPKE